MHADQPFSPTHTAADITPHKERFARFTEPYLAKGPCLPLEIKREHTAQVTQLTSRIVTARNGFSLTSGRAALLAALYHDIGRFPQFDRWKTFSDAHSIDHGSLGVQVLKQEGFLDDEPDEVYRTVLAAVGLHNAYKLPAELDPKTALVTHAVRDADKIDIFRVLAKYFDTPDPAGEVTLHVRNEPKSWSAHVANGILAGKVPSYADLVYVNDFRMLLVSWLRDLHFADSRYILAHSGYVEVVLGGLPDDPQLACVLSCLQDLLKTAKETGQC